MKLAKLSLAAGMLLLSSTANGDTAIVGCIDDMTTGSDPANTCTDHSGHDDACGAENDPCPVTMLMDSSTPDKEAVCGACLTIEDTTTNNLIHATIVGTENTIGPPPTTEALIITSSEALEALTGTTPSCGTDTSESTILECPTEPAGEASTGGIYPTLSTEKKGAAFQVSAAAAAAAAVILALV